MKYFSLVSVGLAASTAVIFSSNALATIWQATHRMSGFSADSNAYVYLESSRDTGAGIPKARLQIVNVGTNSCVQNGCIETKYGEPDSVKTNKMAEDDLLGRTWKIRQQLKLTPPQAGTSLKILSRTKGADGSETLTVQYKAGQTFKIRLEQKHIPLTAQGGNTKPDRTSMRLIVTHKGQQRTLGSLENFREWVFSYGVREVRLSPNGRNVVVLIDRTEQTFEGRLKTTFVQSFTL